MAGRRALLVMVCLAAATGRCWAQDAAADQSTFTPVVAVQDPQEKTDSWAEWALQKLSEGMRIGMAYTGKDRYLADKAKEKAAHEVYSDGLSGSGEKKSSEKVEDEVAEADAVDDTYEAPKETMTEQSKEKLSDVAGSVGEAMGDEEL